MKTCRRCKEDRPTSEFYSTKRNADGKSHWCKRCYKSWSRLYEAQPHRKAARRVNHRRWRENNPDVERDHTFKKKYGITLSSKRKMLDEQGWKCAIPRCGTAVDMTSGHLDHCHKTAVVRGVLCRRCNQGLGNFKDSVELLAGAITYLGLER
jgi:hypothetical protein